MLHGVGREHRQLALLVGLYVLQGVRVYFSRPGGRSRMMARDPLSPRAPAQPQPLLPTLWSAFLQAFTVDDVWQRKIK